jgi:hypothetical protein
LVKRGSLKTERDGGRRVHGLRRSRAEGRPDRERERELLAMFNETAAHVTKEDLEERETLLGGFAGNPED